MKELLPGQILGSRYQIVRLLAEGGFGHTYIAEDTQRPGRPKCIVKGLAPGSSNPKFLEDARRLFQSEAEILEQLGRRHDQIPLLLANFAEDQEFYLVQDFIEGGTLTEELKPGQRWTEYQIYRMLKDALGILLFVHNHQVIHRDIKPDNLIRRKQDGKLVLVDFGAVKQIRTQLTVHYRDSVTIAIGTPGYMSTEQGHGKPRFSSDIYSLGVIGIQAATGLYPTQLQEDPNTGEIIWRPWAQVSDEFANILTQMARYHFKDRYQSAANALQALDSWFKAHPDCSSDIEPVTLRSGSGLGDLIVPASKAPKPTVVSQEPPPPNLAAPSEEITVEPKPAAVSQELPPPSNLAAPSEQVPVAPNPTVVSQGLPPPSNLAAPSEQLPVGPKPTVVSQEPPSPPNLAAPSEQIPVRPKPTVVSQEPPSPPNLAAPSEQIPVRPKPTVVSQESPPPRNLAAPLEQVSVGPQPTVVSQGFSQPSNAETPSAKQLIGSTPFPAFLNFHSMPLKILAGAGALVCIGLAIVSSTTPKSPSLQALERNLPCKESLPPPLPEGLSPDHEYPDGTRYYGELTNRAPADGPGIMIFPNGERYDGEFRDGKRNGCGTLTFSSGIIYTGEFQDDNISGLGKLTLENGDQYIGELRDNTCHGQGTFIFADGRRAKSGLWENDQLVKEDKPSFLSSFLGRERETFFCNR